MDRSHERKLVENLKTGCKSSFQKLFDIYHKKIYNISRKMGLSQENAEDVVQELFLFIWSKREILNPDHSFNAFLQIISKRLVFKQIKSEVNKVSFNAYLQQYGMAIDNHPPPRVCRRWRIVGQMGSWISPTRGSSQFPLQSTLR